jgi:hypothetical protein
MIVDECHRGYLLDREMSDAELSFRSQDDYISKYRRVVEHFDAVKIGLTATHFRRSGFQVLLPRGGPRRTVGNLHYRLAGQRHLAGAGDRVAAVRKRSSARYGSNS